MNNSGSVETLETIKNLKRLGLSSFFPLRVNSRRRCWSDRNILCCCGIMRIKHMLKGNNDWRDMTLKWTRVLSRFIDHKPFKLTLTVYYLVKNDVIGSDSIYTEFCCDSISYTHLDRPCCCFSPSSSEELTSKWPPFFLSGRLIFLIWTHTCIWRNHL